MIPQKRKSVGIDRDIVKEMTIEKAHTGKDIYLLVREGWEAYKLQKRGNAEEKLQKEKQNPVLFIEKLQKNSASEQVLMYHFAQVVRAAERVALLMKSLGEALAELEAVTDDAGVKDVIAGVQADQFIEPAQDAPGESVRIAQSLARTKARLRSARRASGDAADELDSGGADRVAGKRDHKGPSSGAA